MKLEQVRIKGLWHEYDIDWKLYPDVNILVGGNGTGKSTVLDLIHTVIPPYRMSQFYSRKAEKITIALENDYRIECINFEDSFSNLEEKAKQDPSYNKLYQDISNNLKKQNKNVLDLAIDASFTQFLHEDINITKRVMESKMRVDVIDTFDSPISEKEDFSLSFKELQKERPLTVMDKALFDCMEQYSFYIGKLASILESRALKGRTITQGYVENIYRQKYLFANILNDFFKETGKKVDFSEPKPTFILSSGKHISMYDLSSGEKQILYIFLKVLLQEEKDYVLFMDEPEVSLHIDWQEKLIENIRLINPNCQLIITTHSPSLLNVKWRGRTVNLEMLKYEH